MRVAERLVWREHVARALGNISPFDPCIDRMSKAQIEVLLHWRMPRDPEKERDKRVDQDGEIVRLVDEAMWGPPAPSPDQQLANDHEGFDYIMTDDEPLF